MIDYATNIDHVKLEYVISAPITKFYKSGATANTTAAALRSPQKNAI